MTISDAMSSSSPALKMAKTATISEVALNLSTTLERQYFLVNTIATQLFKDQL